MTQVDKICLQYQALGLMLVLVLFSGLGDAEENVLLNSTTHPFIHGGNEEEPRVLAVQRPCGPQHEGFCVHGVCSYSSELETPICRCNHTYSGVRCEHIIMDSRGFSSPEGVIAISCGVVLLSAILLGMMYCCLRRRCQKSSPPYKNYGSENSV